MPLRRLRAVTVMDTRYYSEKIDLKFDKAERYLGCSLAENRGSFLDLSQWSRTLHSLSSGMYKALLTSETHLGLGRCPGFY